MSTPVNQAIESGRSPAAPGPASSLPNNRSKPSSSGTRFAVLDGWRGLSILAVLVCHLFPVGPKSWALNVPLGILGMAIFFCLSGFLITTLLQRDLGVTDFLIRRLCRIVPLAWMGLLFGLWLAHAPLRDALPNYLFYANLPPFYLPPVTAHYWSLGVEVQFYGGIALLYGIFGRRGLLLLPLAALAITGLRIHHHEYASIVTFYRVDEILSGATLALIYSSRFGTAVKAAVAKVNPYVVLALLLASCDARSGPLNYARPYFAALLIGRTLLGRDTAWHPLLRSRSLGYIAAISYALYIVHPLLEGTWLGSGDKLIRYAKRPLLLAATFGVAHLSTYYYEARWIALGKRLTERLRVRRQPAPGTLPIEAVVTPKASPLPGRQ